MVSKFIPSRFQKTFSKGSQQDNAPGVIQEPEKPSPQDSQQGDIQPGVVEESRESENASPKDAQQDDAERRLLGETKRREEVSPKESEQSAQKAIQTAKQSLSSGIPSDYSGMAAVLDALKGSNEIDDRKMLLEQLLVILSRLPPGRLSTKLTHGAVELLYNDLSHPPLTHVGDKYARRAADGSGNNISNPDLGKAGTSYARNVQQSHPLPRHMLPDPGLIFDALLKRDKFVQHPAGLSSLMFSFAALVIHTVFRTDHKKVNINETSSYVDLSPLYGVNAEAQNHIRIRDGRGLLKPDTFCEDRLLLLPPAVCGLLVLFNRNHNYIAEKLIEINERGTWRDPDSISAIDPDRINTILQQEEEIFEIARLINCGWFGSIVFSDYFSSILGLVRDGNSWSLDVFSEFRKSTHDMAERGKGNVCSVEFNCLYRWHATTSQADEAWTGQLMAREFPGKKPDEITPADFKAKMTQIQTETKTIDINDMTFGNMKRQSDGLFDNKDLADLLKNATEHPAGAFKARGTPHSMRWIEIMGIEAARRWGCCSLNDFRRYLGLKPYSNFQEWNPDPEIAGAAQRLYNDVENLELYVGLQAEETKPVISGAALCPGYTISRAILADAVALIRGDRFFTADYTSHNLTAWGFADCQRSADNPGFGSMLGRLLLRTLPTEYSENSTYTWFPLMTPPAIKAILTRLGVEDRYDLSRPSSKEAGPVEVKEYGEVAGIIANTTKFSDPFLDRVHSVIHGSGFFLATNDIERSKREQRDVIHAIAGSPEEVDSVAKFFYEKTRTLINRHSYTLVGGERKCVDIVRDVLKVVPINWVATQLAGIELGENELFAILSDIHSYLFDDVEGSQILKLEEKVRGHVNNLLRQIKPNTGGIRFFTQSTKNKHHQIFTGRLQQSGGSVDQNANSILAIMVGASVELAEALTHMINLLLDDVIVSNTLAGHAKDDSVLEGYISEVLRIDPSVQGVYREVKGEETVGTQSLRQKQLVFLNIAKASLNERAFAYPTTLDPHRPQANAIDGDILTRTLGKPLLFKIMVPVLRAVLELGNVRRGPGQSGDLKRFSVHLNGISTQRYLDQNQQFTPWAQSMVIQYDTVNSTA